MDATNDDKVPTRTMVEMWAVLERDAVVLETVPRPFAHAMTTHDDTEQFAG